jgi:hypothetical protein
MQFGTLRSDCGKFQRIHGTDSGLAAQENVYLCSSDILKGNLQAV